jgi:replicative DNA helicase
VTKVWWSDLATDEMPSDDEMRIAGKALVEEARVWLAAADEAREAPRALVTAREAIDEWIREENADHPQAVHTGWPALDECLGRPIRAGELVLCAARAGVGKTWTLQTWIEQTLGHDESASAVIFELEMLAWHLAERLAGHALGVDPATARKRAREGLTSDAVLAADPSLERLVISEAFVSVEQLPAALEAATERLGRRPTIVAVDYLGLMRWDGSASARTYERASEIAKRLKAVARAERVVVIAAAQMSRDAGDGSSRPTLDALRDSGVVEEAADRVVAFWRPTPIEEDGRSIHENVELGCVVLKNRFGPTGGQLDLVYDHALRILQQQRAPSQPAFPFDVP